MKIKTLMKKLTKELYDNFGMFSTLLEKFKQMNEDKEDDDLIEKHYQKMTKIALELEPVMHIVSFVDPQRRDMEKYILQCISIHNYGKNDINTLEAPTEIECHPFFQPSINYKDYQ